MAELEELMPGAAIRGILPGALVTVVSTQWFGSEALELTYKSPTGKVANELIYRHDEGRLDVAELGRPWSLDGAGALFRLVSEAQRIRLAHLFDPVLAVHTSVVEPLPIKTLAIADIAMATELQVLAKYRTTLVDSSGRRTKVPGLFPSAIHANFAAILDMVCQELEAGFPERFVADAAKPRSTKMKFSAEPYYVLTFLMENERGELSIANE